MLKHIEAAMHKSEICCTFILGTNQCTIRPQVPSINISRCSCCTNQTSLARPSPTRESIQRAAICCTTLVKKFGLLPPECPISFQRGSLSLPAVAGRSPHPSRVTSLRFFKRVRRWYKWQRRGSAVWGWRAPVGGYVGARFGWKAEKRLAFNASSSFGVQNNLIRASP